MGSLPHFSPIGDVILCCMGQETGDGSRGVLGWTVRGALVALFGYALASKLIDPGRLLDPLVNGVGLSRAGAGVVFLVTVTGLLACILVLLLRRGAAGLFLSAVFFVGGAGYSAYLSQQGYAGGCGCGVSIAQGSENELVAHTYQSAACAALCVFIGIRINMSGKGEQDESEVTLG